MSVRPLLLAGLLLTAGTAAALSQVQHGECTYLADWQAQLAPVTSSGPPLAPYGALGACASSFAERGVGNSVRLVQRADVAEASLSTYVIVQKVQALGESSNPVACSASVCSAGPFARTVTYTGQVCATMEIWKDAVLYRSARACA